MLLEQQAACELRTHFSEETHEAFREAGFYRILAPRRFGGLELDVATFYRVMMEIARGCPSTGWELCLSAGHSLQLASYFSAEAQEEIFGADGHFVAPLSFAPQAPEVRRVDGGFEVSATWHFASGIPWSTHHMGLAPVPASDGRGEPEMRMFVLPIDQVERLDNWGDLIGLKGSGSHSVVAERVLVPEHHTVPFGFFQDVDGGSPGSALHGNPMYAGQFMGFALGELNSVQVGNAQAMLDEYERILSARSKTAMGVPGDDGGPRRYEDHDFQRCFGLALAWTDAAHAIMVGTGDQYVEHCRENVAGGTPFDARQATRLYGQHMTVQKLCWEAGDLMFRTSSSSGAKDGTRMQRYWRDLCAFRTNGLHQHDFRAHAAAQAHFGLPVAFT
jgi:3-hydroxy-9,10-secoandrosta-1,3,5(10)-triene-9,17-dione monooxygenase